MAKRKPQPNGRPPAMTPGTITKLEEAFALGCTDREACLWANIATTTLYKYQEKNPDFAERKAQLKETPILKARQSIVRALKDDPKLALSYLERKLKSEFSLRTEFTGADGKDLTPISIDSALLGKFADASITQSTAEDSQE